MLLLYISVKLLSVSVTLYLCFSPCHFLRRCICRFVSLCVWFSVYPFAPLCPCASSHDGRARPRIVVRAGTTGQNRPERREPSESGDTRAPSSAMGEIPEGGAASGLLRGAWLQGIMGCRNRPEVSLPMLAKATCGAASSRRGGFQRRVAAERERVPIAPSPRLEPCAALGRAAPHRSCFFATVAVGAF